MFDYVWLIPFFPLLGAVINGFFGKKLGDRTVSVVACGAVLLSFALSVYAFAQAENIARSPWIIFPLWHVPQ